MTFLSVELMPKPNYYVRIGRDKEENGFWWRTLKRVKSGLKLCRKSRSDDHASFQSALLAAIQAGW